MTTFFRVTFKNLLSISKVESKNELSYLFLLLDWFKTEHYVQQNFSMRANNRKLEPLPKFLRVCFGKKNPVISGFSVGFFFLLVGCWQSGKSVAVHSTLNWRSNRNENESLALDSILEIERRFLKVIFEGYLEEGGNSYLPKRRNLEFRWWCQCFFSKFSFIK